MGHSSDRLVRKAKALCVRGVACASKANHALEKHSTPLKKKKKHIHTNIRTKNTNKQTTQAAKFGVSRREQDEFAALSHQRAAKAHKEGIYKVID